MSTIPDGPVAFDAETARRIVAAVRWVEAQFRRPARPAGRTPWTPSVVRAKVTAAIPAGTFAAPSSGGLAQIHRFDGAAWAASGDPVVVWNQNTGATIPVDRAVMLAWIAGQYWLLTGSCA